MGRERKAGPQCVERLHHFKTTFRRAGHRCSRAGRQVSIRAQFCASDPAAQLVKLRQAKLIRPVNKNRICSRNIQPGLNNCR